MKRLLLFTDPHITPKAAFSQPTSDGLSTYLHRVVKSFHWLEDLIQETTPDYVVCLGDVTETTGFVDTTSLKVATELFDRLAVAADDVGAPVFCLVGNHDAYSTEHNIHNLEFLRHMQNVWVVDHPLTLPDSDIFCIPWTSDPKEVEVPPKTKCILTHLDIEGSFLYKTKRAEFGAKPDMFRVPVFNGHTHNPGAVGKNVQNLGALLSRTFSDVDSDPRGAWLVSVDNVVGTEQFYPNPHDVPFRDVFIKDEATAATWQEKLESGVSGFENCYVRIRYKSEFKELVEQIGYFSQGSRTEVLPETGNLSGEAPKFSSEHFSALKVFETYINSRLPEGIKRKDLVARGIEYLKQASCDIRHHTLPITFEKMEANFFQSLGRVKFQLDQGGLWYVEGINRDDPYDANGVGKSTIHEAIYWCLTGKSLRKYTGDEVIHWDHDYCNVKLWLRIGDEKYWIFRSRKDPDDGTTVLLWKDSEDGMVDISARLKSDTDKKIADLLGRSTTVLQHSVFLTSGLSHKFTSLTYPDRIRLIEEITDVGVFASAGALVKKDTDKISSEWMRTQGSLSSLRETVASSEARISEIDAQIKVVRGTKGPIINAKQRDLKENAEELRSLQVRFEEAELELSQTLPKVNSVELKLKALQQPLLQAAEQTRSIETSIGILSNQVAEIRALIERGHCPECGQEIAEGAPVRRSLDERVAELEDLESRLAPSREKYEKLRTRQTQLQEYQERYREEAAEQSEEVNRLRRNISDLQMKDLELKEELEQLGRETQDLRSAREERLSTIKSTQAEIARLEDLLEKQSYSHEVLEWLSEAFHTTGIRADLLFQVSLPFLNSRLVEYSQKLGQPCHLDYRETKSGDLEEKIEVVLPRSRPYKGLSRGEKMMVDLSIQCALNDLAVATGGSHVNLLICDEVIDPIDETTLASFVDILESKADQMTIFLMAHRPFLDSILPNKLTLVKEDGVTRLGELL